jgi:hypothetical protein
LWVAATNGIATFEGVSAAMKYADVQAPVAKKPSGLTNIMSAVFDSANNRVRIFKRNLLLFSPLIVEM